VGHQKAETTIILLADTNDKLQLVTSAAATLDVVAAYIDASNTTLVPSGGGKQITAITTATTTDILAAPGASTLRNLKTLTVRNKHATLATDVTIVYDDNGTDAEIYKCTLSAGQTLEFTDDLGFYVLGAAQPSLFNQSTADDATGFATDTYLVGSSISVPASLKIGSRYTLFVDAAKTGAGTAPPIFVVRFGTNGSTADTARLTFTFNASTANADVGAFIINTHFRSVGSGTSAVLVGTARVVKGLTATTGMVNTVGQALQVTSGGFDSTVASSIIGASLNAGTSAVWTVRNVEAEIRNF